MSDWKEIKSLPLIEGGYIGVTADPQELTAIINNSGWQLDKIKWQKDSFVAAASTSNGDKTEAKGPTQSDALAALVTKIYNLNQMRAFASKVAAMSQNWLQLTNHMNEIAQDYAKAPYYEMKAGLAWQELATDSRRRAQHIQQQIQVESTNNPAPYTDATKMYEDIRKKRHLLISVANLQHPIWSGEDLVNFRIVHNVMGWAASDAQFGWAGEVQACASHSQLLSTNAQRALLTEQIGRLAFSFYSGGPQPKIAFLKEVEKIIGLDPKTDSWAVHPSQMVIPSQIPDFKRSSSTYVTDPNKGWSSEQLGVQALPNNAYQWGGDPLQAFDEGGMMDTAAKVDSGWYNLKTADGEPDFERMKQAVFNALKVTILSPRKDLKHNAQHYQHVMHVNSDDPLEYQRALETQREQWNQARGYAPGSHKPYYKEQQQFFDYVRQMNPELDPNQAKEEGEREWDHLWRDIEEEYENDPKWAEKTSLDIEHQVAREITKRVKLLLKPDINPDTDVPDQMSLLGAAKPSEDLFGNEAGKYGSWLGAQPKAMAAVYQHIDELTQAAYEDIQQHDGTGHHFRSALLGLQIPGIGPKVASFTWLLLAPTTSQLATIDTHMQKLLGADPSDSSNRDYYRQERELAAGRDAAGYGNVPLGAFQWGSWDALRTGLGSHQDHSAFKTINPVPYENIDWNAKPSTFDAGYDLKTDPQWQWWRDTEPARQLVKDDWNKNVAPYFSQNQIPANPQTNQTFAKVADFNDDQSVCYLAQIRPNDALKIWEWVNTLDWSESVKLEIPDEYHITLFYSHNGWDDDSIHIWLKGQAASNFPVKATSLDLFGPDKDTAVIKLECPELDDFANTLREQAKQRGLDISEFPGGFKAHITIAKNVDKLPTEVSYPFNFRTDSTALAVPLTHPRFSSVQDTQTPWHYDDQGNLVKGFPGQSIMNHLRETYKLTPEQVWESNFEDLGKE